MNLSPSQAIRDMLPQKYERGGMSMAGTSKEYKPGKWRVRVWNEGKRSDIYSYIWKGKKVPITDQRMADRILEHVNLLIDKGEFDGAEWERDKPFSFKEAVKTWISLSKCSLEWIEARQRIADTFLIPFFWDIDLRRIKKIHLDRFFAELKNRGFKEKYIYNIMGELKALLNFHRESIRVPAFPKISYQEAIKKTLTAEQQNQIFGFIPEKDKAVFTFIRFTGCRPNEASGLLRENIFKDADPPYIVLSTVLGGKGQLKPNTKTRKVKPLPIIPEIEWTLKPKEATRFVFSKHGRPYRKKMLERVWDRANAQATVQYGTPRVPMYQGLRHSFATQRLNAGYPLDLIGQVMGHTDMRTTQKYAKYQVGKLEDVMRGMGADRVQGINNKTAINEIK